MSGSVATIGTRKTDNDNVRAYPSLGQGIHRTGGGGIAAGAGEQDWYQRWQRRLGLPIGPKARLECIHAAGAHSDL
jgi:hypothetical protein